jgi:hypothetical protein
LNAEISRTQHKAIESLRAKLRASPEISAFLSQNCPYKRGMAQGSHIAFGLAAFAAPISRGLLLLSRL